MKFDAQEIALLGEGSYPSILFESISKLNESKAETNVGQQLIVDTLTKTSKSLTPILELHAFLTNAQSIVGNDKTVGDVVSFMEKQFKNGDLNYLINVAKENHIQTNAKNGFPFPAETLNEIKGLFGKPSAVIEKMIGEGLFDSLEGDIYTEIKSAFGLDKSNNKVDGNHEVKFDKFEALNESENLVKYSPIGISFRSVEDNLVLLVENTAIVVNNDELVNDVTIAIPKEESRLMGALVGLSKNYKDDSIGLAQRWDLDIKVTKDGEVVLTETPKLVGVQPRTTTVAKEDLKGLLAETIEYYDGLIVKPNGYSKPAYQLDADNLVLLVENHDRLIKMDDLVSLRNTQDNSFVTIASDVTKAPKILTSSEAINVITTSYSEMMSKIESIISHKISGMFDEPITNEQKFTLDKINKIGELMESQISIESTLADVRELKKVSQIGSESLIILNEQENDLVAKLNINLENQMQYKFHHNLYN